MTDPHIDKIISDFADLAARHPDRAQSPEVIACILTIVRTLAESGVPYGVAVDRIEFADDGDPDFYLGLSTDTGWIVVRIDQRGVIMSLAEPMAYRDYPWSHWGSQRVCMIIRNIAISQMAGLPKDTPTTEGTT